MLQSRRGFLIGAGSLLTTAFVSGRALLHSHDEPAAARTTTQVAQTLYWYDSADDGYLLTLGEWTIEPPPAPTWREFFISEGIPHQTEDEIERIWSEHGIWPEDYDEPFASATGRTASSLRIARAPKRIACSETSILDQIARRRAAPFWNFMKARIPATAATGSMQKTSSRCPCCRRGSSISRCRSRSKRVDDGDALIHQPFNCGLRHFNDHRTRCRHAGRGNDASSPIRAS